MHVRTPQLLRVADKGIAMVMVIVIIGAAALSVAINAAVVGVNGIEGTIVISEGEQAQYVADGCVEEAWFQLRLDAGYTGGSLDLRDGACIVEVTPSGSDRTLVVTASTTTGYYAKIETSGTLSAGTVPTVTVNSWQISSAQ